MNIASAATAFPKHCYPQNVLSAAFRRYWDDKLEDADLFERLQAHVGVDGRYLVLPREAYETIANFGETNDVWIQAATDLAEEATSCALTRAGLDKSQIDAIFFVSVTGIASPSIDARLINRMGLSPRIRRTPIFGLGCVAGAAGVARAADYVRAYPAHTALLVSVELCSLTIQRDDLTIANLISCGLFGDGAAAVIVAGADRGLAGPSIVATRSIFYPGTEEVMGWNISEKGFRIVLSPEVPEMARKHLGHDTDEFLAGEGLKRSDIGCWLLHTGGPKVLEGMQDGLGLHDGELAVSWDCLRKAGNLSSASVLQVLEETMERRRPAPGTWGLLAAMGPGFCSELVLLRW
jgi:alkylresorcinol/alkylpyrone synthase